MQEESRTAIAEAKAESERVWEKTQAEFEMMRTEMHTELERVWGKTRAETEKMRGDMHQENK